MRIGVVQFNPVLGDVTANVAAMKRLVSPVDADLLVLPELATSGYAFPSPEAVAPVAEPFDSSPSLDTLQAIARERSCAIVVGFAERGDNGAFYNSSALLRPDGTRELYRKIHLFGTEMLAFAPGDLPFAVHEVGGVRIGMMICFDWLFPESARVLALKGAQIICHPVNFVLPWGQRGMLIRGLENHVYVATANRYGSESIFDTTLSFTGSSQITSPRAEVLAQTAAEGDAVAVVDIDPIVASDKSINRFSDLFGTRRPEFYGDITADNT